MPAALVRKPLPKPSPDSDPRYRRVIDQVHAGAKRTSAHAPASKKARDAADAAKGPPTEAMAGGKAKQVEKIESAKEGKPEPGSFLEALREQLAAAMPKTFGDAEKFDESAENMKGGLQENVSSQTTASMADVAKKTGQPPSPSADVKVVRPMSKDATPPAPKIDGATAMPQPASDATVSLQDSKALADQELKEAQLTQPQLEKANDPRFSAVLDSRQQIARQADAAPVAFRVVEQNILSGARAHASSKARAGAADMQGVRIAGNTHVHARQRHQQDADEAIRQKVVDEIERIFERSKKAVDAKLKAIDKEVASMFDRGVDAAIASMTIYVNERMDRYKDDRYSGLRGRARRIRDWVRGLPKAADKFYQEGRVIFEARMETLIVRVAARVELRLSEAKFEVARGKRDIKTLLANQKGAVRKALETSAKNVLGRFDDLERGIEAKKNELAESIAAKYRDASAKANDALEKIRAENTSAVAAFLQKVAAILQVIRDLGSKLVAFIREGIGTIMRIIADPIGFLGNLIVAVKNGVLGFIERIDTHLINGLTEWLFGAFTSAGVVLPREFTIEAMFRFLLGVLGLTWADIRARIVVLVGPRAAKAIETVATYVEALWTGGPAALWAAVKSDLSDLASIVIDGLREWVATTVVKRAATQILLMLNPAGAFVAALMMIYNLIVFLIERAGKIVALIKAIVGSIAAIASGAVAAASEAVERALAATIPLVLGVLAALANISGITKKVREVVDGIRGKVRKALDSLILRVMKLFGRGKPAAEGPPDEIEIPFAMRGTRHMLRMRMAAGEHLRVASEEALLSVRIGEAIAEIEKEDPDDAAARIKMLTGIRKHAEKQEQLAGDASTAEQAKKLLGEIADDLSVYSSKYGPTDLLDLALFPVPDIDLYGEFGQDKPLPDGGDRIRHHAPPVGLAVALIEPLRKGGLTTIAKKLEGATEGHGVVLPCIRVNRRTHDGSSTIKSIHSKLISDAIEEDLIETHGTEHLTTRKAGGISTNPRTSTFLRQLERIEATKTKKAVKVLFDNVADQSLSAVKIALDHSVVDGPRKKRALMITLLRSRAHEEWKKHLGNLLT